MKVKDLIEDLKHLPSDIEVYVYNPRWKVTPYISVVSTYDESNRRVLYLLSEVNEDIEEKMEAERAKKNYEKFHSDGYGDRDCLPGPCNGDFFED